MAENHFSIEEWADFGRGRTAPEARTRMQEHLDGGCPACAQTLKFWERVMALASEEKAFEPPQSAVRCAKALYAIFPPEVRGGLKLHIARLARFGRPALEGVRGAAAPASHFLFKEGDLLLDLHVQSRAASNLVSLVGQVLDSSQSEQRFENRPVALLREKDALARTATNEYGEFHIEFPPGEDLLLVIELKQKSYLVSRLPSTAPIK